MPFICDVCGEEVSYSEPLLKLRNNAAANTTCWSYNKFCDIVYY